MGKQRSTDSAQKRKGIVKDLDREGSRDKVPEDRSFRRAFESARTPGPEGFGADQVKSSSSA
jgi:hypothetical protein